MLFKYSALLIAVIACYGVTCKSTYDLNSDVQGAIDKTEKSVLKGMDKAVATMEGSAANFNASSGKLIEDNLDRVKQDCDSASNSIDFLVKAATNAGLDVSSCTVNNQGDLDAVLDKANEELVTCVGDKTRQVETAVESATNQVTEFARLTIDGFKTDMAACGSGIEAEKCLSNLLMRVVTAGFTVPGDMSSRASEIVSIVKSLEVAMVQCTTNSANDASRQANLIMATTSLCVNNLVPEYRLKMLAKYNL